MSWAGLEGHDAVARQFQRRLERGRLASTYLFLGPPGIGKRSFALRLAQTLLCSDPAAAQRLEPCDTCESCTLVRAGTHPDLAQIARPRDKSTIPLELLIGSPQRRGQEGLCRHLAHRPFISGRKIAIIDDADDLNVEGANALLKTLEEPPPGSVLILVGTQLDAQLPTIRSRCQTVRFQPLSTDVLAQLLLAEEVVAELPEALRLASQSGGSLERARLLAVPELWEFRRVLLGKLTARPLASVVLARELVAFVDAAGKEASLRRTRARQVLGFSLEFFRELTRGFCGLPAPADAELAEAIARAPRVGQFDLAASLACTERTLEALEQLDRNAHITTLLEAWLDDLASRRAPAIVAV